jgi:hypothetical protein
MNQTELHLKYKSETARAFEPITALAFISKKSFDVILDSTDIDSRILEMLPQDNSGRQEYIEFVDPDYHKWCEEKLMELLKV